MTQTVVNKQLARPLTLTAGLLGILQGLTWFIFSILCICCYFDAIHNSPNDDTTNYYDYIYSIFLSPNDAADYGDLIITPVEFSIFMWFYLPLSFFWAINSGFLIWAMIHNKWNGGKFWFTSWAIITLLISILDLVFVSLLGHDYKVIDDSLPTLPRQMVLTTYGIVLSVIARGFVLWLVNVIFAIIVLKFGINLMKSENTSAAMPIIYGYDNQNVNSPWNSHPNDKWDDFETSSPNYTNKGYENDSKMFERSESFYPAVSPSGGESNYQSPVYGGSSNYQRSDSNNYSILPDNNNKIAKIGKPPGRFNLNNVPPPSVPDGPIIPDPDYSPPGSPTGLKSVLRSTSNY